MTRSASASEETSFEGLLIRAAGNVHSDVANLLLDVAPPPASVLDVGAGSGALTKRLLDLGYTDVEAVDLHGDEFGVSEVKLHVHDVDSPDWPNQVGRSFDAIVAVEVIEHLDTPTRFFSTAAAMLEPGGVLVVSSPNVASWESRIAFLRDGSLPWFDAHRWDKDGHRHPLFDWQVMLAGRDAGLVVIQTASTDDQLLRAKKFGRRLTRRRIVSSLLRPFMVGATEGEARIWVLRKPISR